MIDRYYHREPDAVGRPSYSGLLLFKMTLLQTWYGLSDYEVEDQVSDCISFSRFVGVSMDGHVPDLSVISRFRSAMTKAKAYDKLLNLINFQLEKHEILVRTGVIVDASITDTPRKPRGKKEYNITEDRNEDNTESVVKLEEIVKPNVDRGGRWIKKSGKLRFGFKQHTGVDLNGLILGLVTTSANESDTKHLEGVLDEIELVQGFWVKAGKGYKSKSNDDLLSGRKLKNRIMRKAQVNEPLTTREMQLKLLVEQGIR